MSGSRFRRTSSDWWPELVEAGATDLGGLSANGDHISPEDAFPSPHQVRKELAPRGYALTERLCVYPSTWTPSGWSRGCSTWSSSSTGASSRAEGRAGGEERGRAGRRQRAIEKGRGGEALSEEELTALFAETRPEVVEEMRAAADELRAELAGDGSPS